MLTWQEVLFLNLVEYNGKKPLLGKRVYVDPTATLIGDIVVGEGVGIWPGAVIRADEGKVILEEGVMVLENAIIEAGKGTTLTIKSGTIISHGAIVHGASVGRNCVIGIGAKILDEAIIHDHSIIGSGALVTPNKEIPSKKMVLGIPGKITKDLDDTDLANSRKEWDMLNNKLDYYIKIRGVKY